MATDRGLIDSKRKAIIALFLYAIRLGRGGNKRMVDMSLRTALALDSEQPMWDRAKPLIMKLSNTRGPPSLNWLITLASPYMSWHDEPYDGDMVTRWATMASEVPYIDEVGQSVIDALLHIASVDSLRPHIPVGIWTWLKKQPSLPPMCSGRSRGSSGDVVRQVRALGDIEIIKSYMALVWSEWDYIDDQESGGFAEMEDSIRKDFGGIGMWGHRQDLIRRLDRILVQLDRGQDRLKQYKPSLGIHHIPRAKTQYSKLKEVLLEVDVEAMDGLARKPLRSIFLGLLTPMDTHRISLDFCMCSDSTIICLEHMLLFRPSTWFV